MKKETFNRSLITNSIGNKGRYLFWEVDQLCSFHFRIKNVFSLLMLFHYPPSAPCRLLPLILLPASCRLPAPTLAALLVLIVTTFGSPCAKSAKI